MTTAPKLGTLAVVLRGDRVLLVRRRNSPDAGLWGFPGGHVNWGETALTAAARELAEETGVRAEPVEYIDMLDVICRDEADRVTHHFFLVAVRCVYRSGEPEAADDVDEAAWWPVDDVLAKRMPLSRDVDSVLWQAAVRSARDED